MGGWPKSSSARRHDPRKTQLFLAGFLSATLLLPAGVAYADADLPSDGDYAAMSLSAGADVIGATGSSDEELGAYAEPQAQPAGEDGLLPCDDAQDGETVPMATFHYVIRTREVLPDGTFNENADGLPGAHYGLWMVNYEGDDVYLGLGRNQEEVEGSILESDVNGCLWWDVPVIAGAEYYLLEEWPPPAGHLVDPYPSECFKLVREEGESGDAYRLVFEGDPEYRGHPVVSHVRNETGGSDEPVGGGAVGDEPAGGEAVGGGPAIGGPAGGDSSGDNLPNGGKVTPASSGAASQARSVGTKQASTQKLPNTSDATYASLAVPCSLGALALLAASLNRRKAAVNRH